MFCESFVLLESFVRFFERWLGAAAVLLAPGSLLSWLPIERETVCCVDDEVEINSSPYVGLERERESESERERERENKNSGEYTEEKKQDNEHRHGHKYRKRLAKTHAVVRSAKRLNC